MSNFVQAASGGALYRKSSFLVDSLGQQLFPTHVSLIEDPYVREGSGSSPFDEEGVRGLARNVIDRGVLTGYFLSTYSARKLGMKTTGNAGGSYNLTLHSDRTRNGDDFAAMLRELGTGLLLTEVIGQGVNYVTGDYSRGAAGFWVEGFLFDDVKIKDKRPLTRLDLDKVSTEHPVAVHHRGGHTSFYNSKALAMAGSADACRRARARRSMVRRDPLGPVKSTTSPSTSAAVSGGGGSKIWRRMFSRKTSR
jgi:hypothetical protein